MKMKNIAVFLSIGFVACILPAAQSVAKVQPEIRDELPPAFEHFYGIYLNGIKVGWMQSRFSHVNNQASFQVNLEASVAGMGQVSKIRLDETRKYDIQDGSLEELQFVQTSSTGAVRILGQREGTQMKMRISAGGQTQEKSVSTQESLWDALALYRFREQPAVGQTEQGQRFDASMLRNMQVDYRVESIEKRVFSGIESTAIKVSAKYKDMGITETSWLDQEGKVLETQVGGFFVARLEPEAQAKRLDYVQDLLVSAVVKPPKPIRHSVVLEHMELLMDGFGENLPPASGRQNVNTENGKVRLKLRRDVPLTGQLESFSGTKMKKFLEATPFIQSSNKELVKTAHQVIGKTKNIHEIVNKLTRFVYDHVEDEYVPAYSNALEVLNSRRGDCTEHSVLFVALARAIGLPARVAVGVAYWPPGKGFGWHAWAEVYAQGRWISVDPTWNQAIADATHIKLAGGEPAEQARIVMLLGQLRIDEMSF
jgi:hypothetical protein